MKIVMAILIVALGLISGFLFFDAGSMLSLSGQNLTMLQSVAGGTIAEAYYQEIGRYGMAFSQIAYAMGTGVIMVSVGFGGLLVSTGRKEVGPKVPTDDQVLP